MRAAGIMVRWNEELSQSNKPSALFFPDNTIYPRKKKKTLISGTARDLGPKVRKSTFSLNVILHENLSIEEWSCN